MVIKMTNEKYNGWTNRETWLVNLYFGESLSSMVRENVQEGNMDLTQNENDIKGEIAQTCESWLDEVTGEEVENLSSFLKDFLNLGLIDWYDIAETIYDDEVKTIKEEQENESEEN
ncbi:hypothetical protein PP653_gp039 [Bacillus phage Basilisk]|uniref:Uncharacterized protein n=1 Tax=Bacillus phage Basilisk TaxID=1296654 RepID=S5MS88_9CAUD|nr:hypothetical protein PP653_gp039 [Bacillus phage Basilisk]AGR46662.1 hypothetical protein BASILISK_128 [Bacillus phage Basilisk]